MRPSVRRLPILSVLLAGLTAFAPSGPARAEQTLAYCSEGNPESFNPQFITTNTGINAVLPVYNNLVEFERGTTRTVPGLAESWTVSPDGLVYTFRLRPGVPFHANARFTPTRALSADDVLFSVNRQWRTDHPYHPVSGGNYAYFNDMSMGALLTSVEKLDDLTVRFTLARPEAPFLANLAMPFMAILSAEYAERMMAAGTPEAVDMEPVGTGPFLFEGYQRDVWIRHRAFADHWGGPPTLDRLAFSITVNAAVRLNKLKSGECHVMVFPNPADLERIAADPALTLLEQEELNIGYLAMNVRKKPFDDVRVRRAMNHAIDKGAILDAVYGDTARPAKNPIPPTLWSYNDEIADYDYDPDKARALLAEAGLPTGFAAALWYIPVTRPYNPDAKRMAEMIQADLEAVGVRVTLKTDGWADYRKHLQEGAHDMALYGWTGDNGDPDNFFYVLLGCEAARFGGSNIAKWCDPAFDALLHAAKRTTDLDQRSRYYREAQVIAKREAPWVPIAHSLVFMPLRREVQNYRMDPLGRHSFTGVRLKE